MLFIVGLGLGDERDITLRGLEAVKRCSRVYLEAYTSQLLVGKEKLVRAHGERGRHRRPQPSPQPPPQRPRPYFLISTLPAAGGALRKTGHRRGPLRGGAGAPRPSVFRLLMIL